MRSISSGELARMTDTAVSSFNDVCSIYHFSGATDSDTGEITTGYDSSPSLSVACGFYEGKEFRNERGQIISIDADAILRVAATQTIAVNDKVIAKGVTFSVDGITAGRNVKIAALKEMSI